MVRPRRKVANNFLCKEKADLDKSEADLQHAEEDDGFSRKTTSADCDTKRAKREVCRDVLAFMFVVQPRKVVFHPNALRQG